MLIVGSSELCEFRYQDNSGDNRYCDDFALYLQLEHQIGSSFFKGRFSRDLNHRLLGKFQLSRASVIGIKSVIDPIGIMNCEFNEPCFELEFELRLKNQRKKYNYCLPFQSFLVRNLAEHREFNYIEDLDNSFKKNPLSCLVGIVPKDSYFRKITINPQTDTNDSKIRGKFKHEKNENEKILGFSIDKKLETILRLASRNCS